MARYRPSADLRIANPCDQRWEDMPGDSRVRHCGVCEKDVVNTAAMSPKQIEEMLTGPLPCMRIVRDDTGALLVASEPRAPWGRFAAIAASALVSIAAVAQQKPQAQQTLLGTPPLPPAEIRGRIIDQTGAFIAKSKIKLTSSRGDLYEVTAGPDGIFVAYAQPGEYSLAISSPGFTTKTIEHIELHAGHQELSQPVELQVGALLGVVVIDDKIPVVETKSAPFQGKIEPR